jgi:hypothetical protein
MLGIAEAMMSEPELPAGLDPRCARRAGASVIERGLPGLPEVLTYQMSIPVAYWRASVCAVVLFLRFHPAGGKFRPTVTMGTYFLGGERWSAHRMWASTEQPEPGYPAAVVVGRVAPAVTQIALVQDGHEDRRSLESHFGAWVVCAEKPGPYDVAAFDDYGVMLATLQRPFPPPDSGSGLSGEV